MASKGGLLYFINKLFNRNHAWTDYTDPDTGAKSDFGSSTLLEDVFNRYTGHGLTTSEQQANDFSAQEAQKSRDFTEYMTRNKYQMETDSMEQAGLNPAMVYGGGQLVPTASNGAQANSVSPQTGDVFSVLTSLMRLPKEMQALEAEAQRNRDEGEAALENARSNRMNAESQARGAAVQERLASVQEFRAGFEYMLAENEIKYTAGQLEYLSKQSQLLQKEYELADEYLDVAVRNAKANEKSAVAALQSANAQVRNAATNEYLSASQSAMYRAQAYIDWANGEGQEIINQYLSDTQKETLENIRKQGLVLDKQGNLIDKEGKKVTAETVATYVHAGAEVSQEANRWFGTFVPNFGRSKIGF